jgi:hypothetical protein
MDAVLTGRCGGRRRLSRSPNGGDVSVEVGVGNQLRTVTGPESKYIVDES